MTDLIADIEQRITSLAPQRPDTFYADVVDLSSSVSRLRRVARVALDAAEAGTGSPEKAEPPKNVTPDRVTETSPPAECPGEPGDEVSLDAVRTGDEGAFAALVERHRRELQLHCYRMVGSYDESEDLVQETFLRAWLKRDGFEGRSSFRAWLYRIATNACLDFLRRHSRRPQHYEASAGVTQGSPEPPSRITWLQPYPDELLNEVVSTEQEPDAAVVSRETVELVFLAGIQHLPPRQRAVMIVRDVLSWPAAEAAELLEMSTASVNSALQRARSTLRKHLPERRSEWPRQAGPTEDEQAVLRRYIAATEEDDVEAMAELLREDALLTMPPEDLWVSGRDSITKFLGPVIDPGSPRYFGRWRHLPTVANRQPAAAGYVQRPGTQVFRAQVLDVLRIEDGEIAEVMSFEPHLFPAFGLPLTL
ncbi:sigma-70 family RNA polymerase sigma factor [Amycolatopsis sp. cmx-4-54]|uniref:sigma-70 family RNA polymerase sigma factor n=1 Tax=Amycolatopsis sp. cmx-4-54 TaxID=2790936 RepID=UPI00397BAAF7